MQVLKAAAGWLPGSGEGKPGKHMKSGMARRGVASYVRYSIQQSQSRETVRVAAAVEPLKEHSRPLPSFSFPPRPFLPLLDRSSRPCSSKLRVHSTKIQPVPTPTSSTSPTHLRYRSHPTSIDSIPLSPPLSLPFLHPSVCSSWTAIPRCLCLTPPRTQPRVTPCRAARRRCLTATRRILPLSAYVRRIQIPFKS